MASAIENFQDRLFAVAVSTLGPLNSKWLLDFPVQELQAYQWNDEAVLGSWTELSRKVAELATAQDELTARVWILKKHGMARLRVEWRIEHERFRGARLHGILPHSWIGAEKPRDSSARSYLYPMIGLDNPEYSISCGAQKISSRVILSMTAPCEQQADAKETVKELSRFNDVCIYVCTEKMGLQRLLVGIARGFPEDVRAIPSSYDLKRLIESKARNSNRIQGKSHILLLQNDLSASEVAPLSWEAGGNPGHAFDYVIHLCGTREPGSVIHETVARRSTMGIPGRSADVAKVIREVCAWLRARNEARKLEFQVALENIDPAALGDSVAIVDNQFMLRSFVRDMLKERGWRVSEYDSSTPEFLKGFANSPHDVVLVNLGLPVETQSSIADAVNLSSKFQQPPVVMGYSEESARSQLFLSSLASLMKFSRRESARLLPRQVGQEAD